MWREVVSGVVLPYYDSSGITIYHASCLDNLEWLSAEVMVTDPPYGMALKSGHGGRFGDLSVHGDGDLSARDGVLAMWGNKPALVFGRWSQPKPSGIRAVLTWEKGEHVGMGDLTMPWKPNTEEVYVLGRGFKGKRNRGSVLYHLAPHPSKDNGRLHPTEKPLALMTDLLSVCPWQTVCDPFCGSGSTLLAAKQLGKRAIGFEIEERYCEVEATRLGQGVMDFA